jgi:hypothetical protein
MALEIMADDRKRESVRPFVLKWAERTPESLLGSHRSVFSPPVNGLDVYLAVQEADTCETTTPGDTADSTTPH